MIYEDYFKLNNFTVTRKTHDFECIPFSVALSYCLAALGPPPWSPKKRGAATEGRARHGRLHPARV